VPHIDEARATGALVTAIIVAASDGSIPSLDERTLVLRPWVTFGLDFAAAVTEPPSPPEAAPTDAVAALFHRYVDAKVMTFEEIVRRMTSAVANQFCLTDRGILAAGMYADVLILNRDARTLPTAVNPETVPSAWVEAVVINGFVAARDGKYMNMRVGQLLSRGR
jgi:N-acyl-D-amino-acid deacylase